jgi:hypothetical protein
MMASRARVLLYLQLTRLAYAILAHLAKTAFVERWEE